MCEPTFPVFRVASILSPSEALDAGTALEIAEALHAPKNVKIFVDGFIEALRLNFDKSSMQTDALFDTTEQPSHIAHMRFRPTNIIDFPAIKYRIGDCELESRVCMTVCITGEHERQIKIWLRTSCINSQNDPAIINKFFNYQKKVTKHLLEYCVSHYIKIAKNSLPEFDFQSIYQIAIRFLSSNNTDISEIVEATIDSEIFEEEEKISENRRHKALKLIKEILTEKSRFTISQKPDATRQVLTLCEPKRNSKQGDSYEGLCLLEIGDNSTEALCVGYESEPPVEYLHSVSHILSGELSNSIGQLY